MAKLSATLNPAKPKRTRVLSPKQTQEIVWDLFLAFETRKREGDGIMCDTIKAHTATFLNQKYGLKSLVEEYRVALEAAVQKQKSHEFLVAVYWHVIHNELDVPFFREEERVRQHMQEALARFFQQRHPSRSSKAIKKVVDSRLSSFILENEWYFAVCELFLKYEEKDWEDVRKAVAVRINENTQAEHARVERSRKITPRKKQFRTTNKFGIAFDELLKLVVWRLLQLRTKELSQPSTIFKQVDRLGAGFLNEHEFARAVLMIDSAKDEVDIEKLLHKVDPLNLQKITFSDCACVLESIPLSRGAKAKEAR